MRLIRGPIVDCRKRVGPIDQRRHHHPAAAFGQTAGNWASGAIARRKPGQLFGRLIGVGHGHDVGDRHGAAWARAASLRSARRAPPASGRRTPRSPRCARPAPARPSWRSIQEPLRLDADRAAPMIFASRARLGATESLYLTPDETSRFQCRGRRPTDSSICRNRNRSIPATICSARSPCMSSGWVPGSGSADAAVTIANCATTIATDEGQWRRVMAILGGRSRAGARSGPMQSNIRKRLASNLAPDNSLATYRVHKARATKPLNRRPAADYNAAHRKPSSFSPGVQPSKPRPAILAVNCCKPRWPALRGLAEPGISLCYGRVRRNTA